MHTVGIRLRAKAALSSSSQRGRVRRRCFFILQDGPNARSLPPWPHRHHKPSASLGCNGVTTNTSRRNASHESPQVAAVTNDDFPRVLNGPAPGYAEDALRRLLLCAPSLDILEGGTLIVNSAYRDGDHSSLPWPKSKRRLNSVAKFELLPSPSATASLKWDDGGATAALAEKASPGGQQQQGLFFETGLERPWAQRQRPQPNSHTNGYTDGHSNGQKQRPHQASAVDAANEEEAGWDSLECSLASEVVEKAERDAANIKQLPYSKLWRMQLAREKQSHQEACDKYSTLLKDMVAMGKSTHIKPIERLLTTWYPALKERIQAEQEAVWANLPDEDKKDVKVMGSFGGRNTYGPLLIMLKSDKQAVLVMHEAVNLILAGGNEGVSTVKLCTSVAELVQAEVNVFRMEKEGRKIYQLPISNRRDVKEVNKRAEDALETLKYAQWPKGAQVKLGAALVNFLVETAFWTRCEGHDKVVAWEKGAKGKRGVSKGMVPQPAFIHNVLHLKNKRQGTLSLAPEVHAKMVDQDIARLAAPRYMPMLIPPQKWTRPESGGFIRLRSSIIRMKEGAAQKNILHKADLSKVYEGLNCLGKVRWRINTEILDIVTTCLRKKIAIRDLPTADNLPFPPAPEGIKLSKNGKVSGLHKEPGEDIETYKERVKPAFAYRRMVEKVKTKNANMHSLRCDMKVKVDIAEEFRDHVIYFPYNMDFRGRTYPIPPNLNILGSDFCRGVLMFDDAKPLGETGLYWMKVHLANLYGNDKASFDDRVSFVEQNMDKVRDSALRPLEGGGWWKDADNPWQCLAMCKDLAAALDRPDPSKYISRLPVHQDGSCNGLQHYAALGLDATGGAQVNLVPSSKPQDVYTAVCNEVIEKVALKAATGLSKSASVSEVEQHRICNLVNGLIDRKVIKQTVMTSVYGVTFVGACKQIHSVLAGKIITGTGVPTVEAEKDAYKAAAFVAKYTMKVLEELFTEARNIMGWLMAVSKLVSQKGQPMAWITPIGLPVLQPYRKMDTFQVQTLLQGVHIREDSEKLPIAVSRQKSAFPPNFVHSLDSTHMMLTAIEMDKAGIPFAAVHDSYWVHAGNIEHMNSQLRQSFIDLYSGPILEDLLESLQMRYPSIDFPPIPERGSLRLEDLKDSKYFFN